MRGSFDGKTGNDEQGVGPPTRLAEGIVVKAAGSLRGQMEDVWHEARVWAPGSVRKGERREAEGQLGPQATAWGCSPPAPARLPAITARGHTASISHRGCFGHRAVLRLSSVLTPKGLLKGADAQLGPEPPARNTRVS